MTKCSDRPSHRLGVGGWTFLALPWNHISWQLPFSVLCLSLVASRLPSPHQLCFSHRLFLLRFPECVVETVEGAETVSPNISELGLRTSRPPLNQEWKKAKAENWNEKHPKLLGLTIRWRTCSPKFWMEPYVSASILIQKLGSLQNRKIGLIQENIQSFESKTTMRKHDSCRYRQTSVGLGKNFCQLFVW